MMKHYEMFTGRVGKIGELKEFGDNNCVLNFSVAEGVRKKNASTQQWEDVATIWTEVTVFGDEARNFLKSAQKGTTVTVVGTRTAREYTPTDSNEKRTIQSVQAEQISVAITKWNFIEGIGNTNGRSTSANAGGNTNTPPQGQTSGASNTAVDQDPFASSNPFATDEGSNPFAI